jgi:hypothetical protein
MSHLKIEAARRQLGHALDLFLQDRDPVSVHCLAGGGCELIEYHATKAGGEPFTSFMLKTNPDLDIKTIRKRQRQYWTAFKHATTHEGDERDDDHLLSRFTDENNDVALLCRLVRLWAGGESHARRGTGLPHMVRGDEHRKNEPKRVTRTVRD